VDFARMQDAVNALTQTILTLQGDGDYDGVGRFQAEYGAMSASLKADLERLNAKGIPVDIVYEQ
jgi:hypothetical protein